MLVKTISVGKGAETRTFVRDALDKPAYRKPLEAHARSLDEALEGLVDAGLLEPVGTDRFKRSQDGNLAAHAYRDFAAELGWHQGIPSGEALSYEYLPTARERLREICEDHRRG